MKTDIPAGYSIGITTWENDGDHYKTTTQYGLTKADVYLYIDLAKQFGSDGRNTGLGNDEASLDDLYATVQEVLARHPEISEETRSRFDIGVPEWDGDEYDDPRQELHYNLCEYILGDTEDYEDYENFCRAYDSHKVHYYPEEIRVKDVTDEFK